jgi:hypothetical protein
MPGRSEIIRPRGGLFPTFQSKDRLHLTEHSNALIACAPLRPCRVHPPPPADVFLRRHSGHRIASWRCSGSPSALPPARVLGGLQIDFGKECDRSDDVAVFYHACCPGRQAQLEETHTTCDKSIRRRPIQAQGGTLWGVPFAWSGCGHGAMGSVPGADAFSWPWVERRGPWPTIRGGQADRRTGRPGTKTAVPNCL